jgi:hypothetical protein
MNRYIVRLTQPRSKDIPKEMVFESEKLEHYPEEKDYNKYEGWYLLDGQTKEQALTGTRVQDGPKQPRKRPSKKEESENETLTAAAPARSR